ncbi:MAG TPA: outer membrane lipoprotein carrier protein LolA [Acetobacteraceae bacterium]|nr:outer membrane lipoprotein carrier protein LolA [Acetobacteraceae bacterium]
MKRRIFLGLLAAPALLPVIARAQVRAAPLTPADQADIARIEAYLNGLKTLKGRFLQVAPDGGTSSGTAWIQRPGRMRFQYDPPSPYLLVAGGGLVVFRDNQLNQTSNLLIGQTPLGILLADNIRLSGPVTVTGISRLPDQIQVTLVRNADPGSGNLTLVFSDNPLALRQWSVIDGQRKETRVSLFNVELGGTFNQDMFYLANPSQNGPKYNTPGSGG